MKTKTIEDFRSSSISSKKSIVGGVVPEPIYDADGNIIGWKTCTDHTGTPDITQGLPGSSTITQ